MNRYCLFAIIAFVGFGLLAAFGSLAFLGSGGEGENPNGSGGGASTATQGVTSGPLTTSLEGFDRNRVIEDSDFINTGTMTAEQIQQFLVKHKSVLTTLNDNGRSAAQIIYDASQKHGINPQVIIVVLHKEQSLIGSNTDNLSKRLGHAMGAGCPDSGDCDVRLGGFTKQVEAGTAILRRWFDRAGVKPGVWAPGDTATLDGQSVTFANKATISLYKYTPHIVPDKTNFYRYFRDFFLTSQ